jgi:alkylation response protein AidB-like acyl-CoA dehydrogenase
MYGDRLSIKPCKLIREGILMVKFINDPQFGEIVDFEALRGPLRASYDALYPEFNMLESNRVGSRIFNDEPSHMIAAGASMLAWQMLSAADEFELADELRDSIFTLGWTEEHTGSDLLSAKTAATPLSDDPENREYHIKGQKWLINNSYHADYHMVLAKVDPTQDGPRSLSLFLVPRSSTKNWQRLETHVLRNMVLTKFDIDGPGRLVGRKGHGLSIVQRMAMPSKYQCAYLGMQMTQNAIPATIDHLSTKRIFGNEPIQFSNVFRQMYNIALETAFINFLYHRAIVFSDSSFLAFHGTMLKSFLLLRANETLSQNWLVAGSKGFLRESIIGRDAIDSFVLPVFDGHYTINTLMTAKHMSRYLKADQQGDLDGRIQQMRDKLFIAEPGDQINKKPGEIRNPAFFNYVEYFRQLNLSIDVDVEGAFASVRALMTEMDETGYSSEAEYKYKTGTLVHWLEAILAAGEMVRVFDDERYLNVVVQQYNGFVQAFNDIVSEGNLQTDFLTPMRHVPLPEVEDNEAFLRDLLALEDKVVAMRQPVSGD